jgi:hypothetical protein
MTRIATTKLKIKEIRIDGGTQPRMRIEELVVTEYAEDMTAGVVFPPVEVYHDGSDYWLTDGFHRVLAAGRVGKETIEAIVHRGTREDAQWAALGANKAHGLRRTNADKQKAVTDALKARPELTDNAIAEHVGVSNHMVARHREKLKQVGHCPTSENSDIDTCATEQRKSGDKPEKRTGVDGKQYPAKKTIKVYTPEPSKPARKPGNPTPKPDKSTDPVDEVGNALPRNESIRIAFQRRGEITELMTTVSRLKTHVLKVAENGDPLYAELNVSRFQADCGNLHRALRAIRPYAVCPYCEGQGCDACLKRGWVGEFTYEHAPKDMKGKA